MQRQVLTIARNQGRYAMTLKILHLEDNPADAELVQRTLRRAHLLCDVQTVDTADAYQAALQRHEFDVILSDSGIPGYDGSAALEHAHSNRPGIPFIVVSGHLSEDAAVPLHLASPAARVSKNNLDSLPGIIESTLQKSKTAAPAPSHDRHTRDMQFLVSVIQALSLARSMEAVMDIVRHAARKLVNADGATFVLRDGECCFYAQEDAISPLWRGQRFPLTACISGWAMLNRQAAVVPDIYEDARIPHDAYRPTFVQSLVMTPIRTAAPIGAIGVYWAHRHQASREELELLVALADSTSVAIESVDLLETLEKRVVARTQEVSQRQIELEVLNRELEAFSYSVAHDLRSPLLTIDGFGSLLMETCAEAVGEEGRGYLERITVATRRMQGLIDDLLALSRIVRAPMNQTVVNVAALATELNIELARQFPQRSVDFIAAEVSVRGDAGMLRIVLDNLLSNAWKFTSKTARARVELGTCGTNRGLTTLFLRDNGAGFDPRYSSKLFSPFHRLHTQEQFPGTGVGLATVRRIINRHGGDIRAEGAVDQGATFYFSLPTSREHLPA
jgi:signal transduction histidine kinase